MDNGTPTEIAQLTAKPGFMALTADEKGPKVIARPTGSGQFEILSIKKLLDEYADAPERRKGTAKASTLESFTDLVNRHKDADSVVFAVVDPRNPSLLAVLDYNTTDHKPRFGQHRVAYSFPVSEEWKAWLDGNGKVLSQEVFAAFIENHIADLSAPMDQERSTLEPMFATHLATPAELIQMSRGLQMTVDAKIGEVRNLQSGEAQITFIEEHKNGAGEKLIIPGLFVINIPLFIGAAPTRLIARLRYRRQDGAIVWFYQLWRWESDVRNALLLDVDVVRDGTALPVFEGVPEA